MGSLWSVGELHVTDESQLAEQYLAGEVVAGAKQGPSRLQPDWKGLKLGA